MKIAVVGGTGMLGRPLVAELASLGDEVLALSRKPGEGLPDGVADRCVDLTTGEGLTEALVGVEVVVDASNSDPRNAGPVLVEGTRRLLRAGTKAGVAHHVGVSIVGCDKVPMAYYKVKVEQEEAIAAGGVPWSVLRATQFHSLLGWAFEQTGRLRVRPTGKAPLQPVDAPVVAAQLAEAAHAEPGGYLPEVAGPQVQTLSELAADWRRVKGQRALPLPVPSVGRILRPIGEGALCHSSAAAGGSTFEQWLADE